MTAATRRRTKNDEIPDMRLLRVASDARRRGGHWLATARSIARLMKSRSYTQRRVGRAFGLNDAQVSRLLATLRLPEAVLEHTGSYSLGVFTELATCADDAAIVGEVLEAMAAGSPVTQKNVRELKRARGRRGRARASAPAITLTYRDLPALDPEGRVRVRVHDDSLELRLEVDWPRRTFRDFDLLASVREVLGSAFRSRGASVTTFEGLNRLLTRERRRLRRRR